MPIKINAADFKPSDAFGLYREKAFSPISGTAPKPLSPEEQERERATAEVTQRNQATTQSYEQLNTAEPGRYQMVDETALSAWQTDWQARQPGFIEDTARIFGGAVVEGTGSIVQGLGHVVQSIGNTTTTPIINNIFGTSYGQANPLAAPAEWLDNLGEKTKEGMSFATKEAIANSTPDGDILNPSTWTLGKAPSLAGYAALTLDVFGQMAPVLLAAVTGPIAGAAVGGAQGGGAASQQANDLIDQMASEPGLLEKESAFYREQIAAGVPHDAALAATKNAAGQAAFWFTAPISAMGGAATSKIIDPATNVLAGKAITQRILGRAALSGLEEGTQEAAESIATKAGMNAGAGMDQSLTEGTFADFMLGALAGAPAGGAAGAFSKREGAASDTPVAQNGPSVAQNPGSETQTPPSVAPTATVAPGGRPAGVLTRARDHGIATAPDAAAGVELVVNDPSLPGQGAGMLHGQTVRVSPNQSGVDPTMLNVMGEDGGEQLVAKRLLQDTTGAKLVPDPQGLDTPLVTNKGQNTLAPAGSRAIVAAPGMPEFVGQIQEYIETPDGLEALVSDDQGELLQIPASFLSVSMQTKDQAFEEELQENPPLPPTEPVQQTGTVREIRNGQGQPTNLDFPDEIHAKLFDFGRERATIKGLNRVTGEGGGLAIRDYAPERAKELADLLGVSQERVAGIADDYRYRAERAARTGTAKNVSKMHSLDAEKLKGWQRERAKSDLVAPEDAITAEERTAFAGLATDEDVRKYVYDRASETMFPDQADHVADRAVERWNADRAADAQLSAQIPDPVEDDAATWWGKLPLGARKAALASAGVKRNEKSGWNQFSKPIQTKLKIVQGEFAAVDIARQRMRKADPTPGVEISTPAPIEMEAGTAQNITQNIPSSVSAPIDTAANEAATSPSNDLPEPTAAQKEAGNYKVGHATLGGLSLSIENPAGSERKGVDKGGKPWSVTMRSHYGYIKGTVGKDKDHIDVFVKPGTADLAGDAPVFVVDQVQGASLDEHKVMLGFDTIEDAREAYLENYAKGWKGLGDITATTLDEFKGWLVAGNTSGRFGNKSSTSIPSETPANTGASEASGPVEAKATESSPVAADIKLEEKSADYENRAPVVSPVNGKPLQNDAGNTLVLMACAQAKISTDKPVPLLELYNGPLWQDLRSKRGGIPERNLFAMSGKLGLTSVSTFAMPYEEKISAEKVNAFIERPITKGAPTKPGTAGPSSPFASIVREGKPFTQVIIYGSGDYRRAFDYLTAELIAAGAITADAPIVAAEGSILQQRKQFNKFLRDVNGTDKAAATQNTAIEADTNELPTPAEAKATPPVQKQLDQTQSAKPAKRSADEKTTREIYRSEEWREVYGNTNSAGARFYADPASPAAGEWVQGWLDAKADTPPQQEPNPNGPDITMNGFNPSNMYLRGYIGGRWGDAVDVRAFDAPGVFRSIVAGTYDVEPETAALQDAKAPAPVVKATAESETVSEPTAPPTDDAFAKTTLFTADKVADAKARLKSKLDQIDPGPDLAVQVEGLNEVLEAASAFSDPLTVAERWVVDPEDTQEALDQLRTQARLVERAIYKKYGVKNAAEAEDAGLTDAEDQFLFRGEGPTDTETISHLQRVIEPIFDLADARAELRRAVKALPDTADYEAMTDLGKTAVARLLVVGAEISRLGADPKPLIKAAVQDIANQYEDQNDAEFMTRSVLERLRPFVGGMNEAAPAAEQLALPAAADTPVTKPGTRAFTALIAGPGVNLLRWFAGSKVVDANKQPRVMYHGANVWLEPGKRTGKQLGDFNTFDRRASVDVVGNADSMDTVGSWFSSEPDEKGAGMYAGSKGAIYPVYLKVKNPWKPASFDAFLDQMHIAAGRDPAKQSPKGKGSTDELRTWLKDQGYDGIMFSKGMQVDGDQQEVWVALEPEQIKSATGNSGAFDPKNPDIRYDARQAPEGWGSVENLPEQLRPDEIENLNNIVRQVAGLSKVEWRRRIIVEGGNWAWGTDTRMEAAGFYDPHRDVIALTTQWGNPATAYHEAFHRLQWAFLTDKERKALASYEAEFRDMIVKSGRRTQEATALMALSELEADAFGVWAAGLVPEPSGFIARVWRKIRNLGHRSINLLIGLGYQVPEDIFTKALSGEIAARKPLGREQRRSGKRTLNNEWSMAPEGAAFQDWFGDSKIVDKAGKPLAVYHGTNSGDFDTFRSEAKPTSLFGKHGLFFAEDREEARQYTGHNPDTAGRRKDPNWEENARVMSVYLRMENPAVLDESWRDPPGVGVQWLLDNDARGFEAVAEALMEVGYDGIIYDTEFPFHPMPEFVGRHFVVFSPRQVKSVDNGGGFDLNDPRIQYDAVTSPAAAAPPAKATKPANARIQNIKDEIKGLFTDMQPSTLALVPLNYFEELKRPGMVAVDHYLKVKRLMDAYRGDKHAAIDVVAQEWRKYARLGRLGTDKAKAAALADLMHETTLAGIDPSRTDEEYVKPLDPVRYEALRKRYLALSPSGQALYRRVRDTYREQADELDQILLDNVRKTQEIALRRAEDTYREKLEEIAENTKLSDIDRSKAKHEAQQTYASESNRAKWNMKARMTKLRTVFEASRVPEPYFPLSRFGQYYVTVRDVDGTVLSFSKREKEADRIRLERDMRAAFPNHKVESGKLAESGSARTMMDPRIVAEIETLLGDMGVDSKVMDMVWQRYLETMPDLSARKRFIHRKGVAGFEGDALRTFASAQFHAAHQMARLKYGLELTELANQATDQAKKADQPVKAMQLADELGKRHEWVMNPKGNAVANAATQAMFFMHLAATPAAAILNLTQTPMMGIPILGARLGGIGKATAAIGKASGDLIKGKGTVRNSNLTAEEKRALEAFYESGMIERSQGHDLAGIGETGIGYSPGWFKFMSVISWAYHNVEVWNREVTALAAFRMAREQGNHEGRAIDIAHDLTWAAHFDYSNSSRPRFMQGDFAKVALTFQSHQVNMWYRIFRDIHQSIKGETPQAKKEARYQLAGIMGMATLFGGVTGFFGYNVLIAIAGMVFDDDDDPRTFKAEMEGHVVEILGPEIGGMILNGVPGHLTGIDLTSRVGMADFFLRAPDSGAEGREYWKEYLVGALGVVPSTAINTIDGFGMMMEGDVARGAEVMAPKVVKDALKFYRYLNEGVISRNGDVVLEKEHLSPLDLLVQFAGFTPAIVAETYDRMGTLKDAEQHVLDERRELMNRFALAVSTTDPDAKRRAIDAIRAWNKKPYARTVPITADGLTSSLKSRARNRNKREDGVLIADPELGQLLRGLMPDHVY